jgi:hypothetical protein
MKSIIGLNLKLRNDMGIYSLIHPIVVLYFIQINLRLCPGRGTAQAASRRLPTSAARIRAQVRSCGICGGQSGTGAGFLRVLGFPLPILIPQTAPYSSIIWGWYNRPVVADVPSGLSLTPPQETERKLRLCPGN